MPMIRTAPNNRYWLVSIRLVFFLIVSNCFFNISTSVWFEELSLTVFDEKNLYLMCLLENIARNILNSFWTTQFYLELAIASKLSSIWIYEQFLIFFNSKLFDNQKQSALKMRSTRFSFVALTFDFLWIRCMLNAHIFLFTAIFK